MWRLMEAFFNSIPVSRIKANRSDGALDVDKPVAHHVVRHCVAEQRTNVTGWFDASYAYDQFFVREGVRLSVLELMQASKSMFCQKIAVDVELEISRKGGVSEEIILVAT